MPEAERAAGAGSRDPDPGGTTAAAVAPREGLGDEEPTREERRTITVLAAIQLMVVLDFTLLLPLGPDLMGPLRLTPGALSGLAFAYAAAAVLAGFALGARRGAVPEAGGATPGSRSTPAESASEARIAALRRALVLALGGIAAANVLAALATGPWMLGVARVLSGACGGPAVGFGVALVAERVPEARRGRAMGTVLGANAVAPVLGVPLGLWLSGFAGFRAAFAALAVGAALAAVGAARGLRGVGAATEGTADADDRGAGGAATRGAHALLFAVVAGTFALVPNLSAFAQYNLGVGREDLPVLYGVGGLLGVVTIGAVGRAVDRIGAGIVGGAAMLSYGAAVLAVVVADPPWVAAPVGMVALLVSVGARNVAVRTLAMRVPAPAERGRFMAHQTSAQHLGAAAGAGLGVLVIGGAPEAALTGMPVLGGIAAGLTLFAIGALLWLERAVGRR